MSTAPTATRGRPPKLRDGVRVKDLPTLTVRLPEGTKARLLTLAKVTRVPAYELIERALADMWSDLPDHVRQETEQRERQETRWRARNPEPKEGRDAT